MRKNKNCLILLALLLFFRLFIWPKLFIGEVGGFTPFQERLEINFASLLPSKAAGLLSGIVLGSKKTLSTSLYQQLQQTGTLHIVVASGMNITLLAGFIFPIITLFLKRKIALVPLSGLIWFYALLSGFQPPIVRASLMAVFVYFAQEFGRPADSKRILWLTGYVMVLINPTLISDLAFQLSFGSMLGLIYIEPILRKTQNFVLRLFSSTLACQIATLPLLMMNFGEYNLLSPLINLLVLWTTPYILCLGLLAAFFSLFINPVAQLLAYLAYPFLAYFTAIIGLFSDFKIFQVWMPKWGIGLGIGYYLLLVRWIQKKLKYKNYV